MAGRKYPAWALMAGRRNAGRAGQREEKDTQIRQRRFLAFGEVMGEMLAEHRTRCEERSAACG
jgi:hypothetical protein